jgi:putative ABC transport system permease protein
LPWLSAGGRLAFWPPGGLLMLPEWNLIISFAGLFAVIIGAALLYTAAAHLHGDDGRGVAGARRAACC